MSTIITTIGAAVILGLVVIVAALWRRTHRELRRLTRDLLATQQELEIQRIVADQPDGHPKRRHLRALAILAPLLLWIREHHTPVAAISAAAVGTVAAVTILTQAGAPSEPHRPPGAAPLRSPTPPSDITSSSSAPTSAMTSSSPSVGVPDIDPSTTAVDETTRSIPPTPAITTTSGDPVPTSAPSQPPTETPPSCIELHLIQVIELGVCITGGESVSPSGVGYVLTGW